MVNFELLLTRVTFLCPGDPILLAIIFRSGLWRPVHDCQCFISSFSLQIWFHCISSVLGIIVILKTKTVPNTLSWRNGMMGLFSSHTVFFHLYLTLLIKCEKSWREVEQWVLAALVWLDVCQLRILSELKGSECWKWTQVLINYLIPSVWLGTVSNGGLRILHSTVCCPDVELKKIRSEYIFIHF